MFFVLYNDIVVIFFKGSFVIFWIFDGVELGIFDNGVDSLFLGLIRLDFIIVKEFYECCFCFFGGGIFRIVVGGDEGLCLNVVVIGELFGFFYGFFMVVIILMIVLLVVVVI